MYGNDVSFSIEHLTKKIHQAETEVVNESNIAKKTFVTI